jgi:acyl-coenzyme A thioesterase PaaI-like protein
MEFLMKELPHTRSCFVCGESNPIGFNLRSETDGRSVRARVVFGDGHVGFKHTIHGGLIATLLDEIMTWACAVQVRRFAYCAELNIRYLLPVRPREPLVASAELAANRRGRLFETKADLRTESGVVLATATGKYLPLKDREAAGMTTDFVGDIGWVLAPANHNLGGTAG